MILSSFDSLLPRPRVLRAALVACTLIGAARTARAQDDVSEGAPPVSDADKQKPEAEPPAPKKSLNDVPAPPAPADVSSTTPPGPIERLPASAYPAPFTRGLHGGSLWLNSQGLQWPYIPHTGIGISGYAWLDSDYERVKVGDTNQQNIKEILQQGRLLLRVTPTYNHGDFFVQAQAELVANKDQTQGQPVNADVDDVWIRAGKWKSYDVTVGRFEGFEVYHLGMGLDLNTEERRGAHDQNFIPPDLYGASVLFYRPSGPGNIALHFFPTDYLRVELLQQIGNDGKFNAVGTREAAVLDVGWLKLKVAGEYQLDTPQFAGDKSKKVSRGVAGSAQFVFDPYLEFGGNIGGQLVDLYDNVGNLDSGNSTTKTSFGGFLNARIVPDVLFGFGVNDVRVTNQHFQMATNSYGEFANLQLFGALQYFWDSQLMTKLVLAYAKGDNNPTFSTSPSYSNSMYSARLRFEYLF